MSAQDFRKGSVAVALRYDGDGAPRVTAKGRGPIADAILERAREHNVPISNNGDLVQLLSQVELGDEIPESLYVACAQVIAFAYHLRGKGIAPGMTRKTK
ncbi:MAG: EscU/YscU/HrcU family type III secretion system export apparatus switch protein [Gammaproteobacteria bacterium]